MRRAGEKEVILELAPHISGVEDKQRKGISVHCGKIRK